MTTDERFERIEHVTAALVDERRKDREEYKALWRDTQRHFSDLAAGMVDLRRHTDELAVETRFRFDQVADRIQELVTENRATNERLERLTSAVGALAALAGPPPPQ